MTEPLRIALLGFGGSERAALEAFLRVAHRRVPAYARVSEVEQAQLVLVDADDPAQHARAAALGGSARCVAVGAVALPAAVLQLPRPLNVLRLFSRLDRLLEGPPVASPGSAAAGGSIASVGPIAPINAAVPAETQEAVAKVKAGLKDGSFAIWKGPIVGSDGKEVLAKDAVADDKFLGGINFYVKGVEGKVPAGK